METNQIRGILVTFFREATKGDYLEALNKADGELFELIKAKIFLQPVVTINDGGRRQKQMDTNMEIIHSLSEKPASKVKNDGSSCFISWERLKKHFASEVGLKEHEKIIGIIADDKGVIVKIESKQ